jgi:hypothetical protein
VTDNNKLARLETGGAIEPATLGELAKLAGTAADSGFFGAQNQAQAMMLMLAGRDIGFSYTQSLRAFHVIKGKPSLSADAMVAVCLSRKDLCVYFRCVESTKVSATWETERVGNDPVRLTFTIEEAKDAGIITDMYRKFPARMLSARCKAYLARDVYPELLMGLYDPDELAEVQAAPTKAKVGWSEDRRTVRAAGTAAVVDAEIVEENADRPTVPDAPPSKPDGPIPEETTAKVAEFTAELAGAQDKAAILDIQARAKSELQADAYLRWHRGPFSARYREIAPKPEAAA